MESERRKKCYYSVDNMETCFMYLMVFHLGIEKSKSCKIMMNLKVRLWCLMPLSTIFSGKNWSTKRKPSTCRKSMSKLYHTCISSTPRLSGIWTNNVNGDTFFALIYTDGIGSCKNNYNMIMIMTDPEV